MNRDWSELILRWGLAALFVANASVALKQPYEFLALLERVGLFSMSDVLYSFRDYFAWAIVINDGLIALFLIINKWLKPVSIWVGLYLALIAIIKLLALFGNAPAINP